MCGQERLQNSCAIIIEVTSNRAIDPVQVFVFVTATLMSKCFVVIRLGHWHPFIALSNRQAAVVQKKRDCGTSHKPAMAQLQSLLRVKANQLVCLGYFYCLFITCTSSVCSAVLER